MKEQADCNKLECFEEATAHFAIADIESRQLTQQEGERIVKIALRYLERKHRVGSVIDGPAGIRVYLRTRLADRRNESFGCVFLSNRHAVLGLEEIFKGTVDGAVVHPRVVVQRALSYNAAAVILFHNHPSGVAEPSAADRAITRRLKDALALIDVSVLDHVVVSASAISSMAERGQV